MSSQWLKINRLFYQNRLDFEQSIYAAADPIYWASSKNIKEIYMKKPPEKNIRKGI